MEEVSGMSVPAAMGSGAKAVKYTIGNEVRYGYLTQMGMPLFQPLETLFLIEVKRF